MKRLPDQPHHDPPEWQPARLHRWLTEWHCDQQLRDDGIDAVGSAHPADRVSPTPLGVNVASGPLRYRRPRVANGWGDRSAAPLTALKPGEIRLLHPAVRNADRPLYIAILFESARETFCIAPFGRFSEPATPGEWLTGRTTPALRVLCLWNSQEWSRQELEQSWAVDQLTADELHAALLVLRSVRHDGVLATPLLQQTGPPLVHPLDPRWDYIEEERELMFPRTTLEEPHGSEARQDESPLSLAAESPGSYAPRLRFNVQESGLRLVMTDFDRSGLRQFIVCDERGAVSTELDGAIIRGPDAGETEPIREGLVELPDDWLARDLTLLMTDGRRLVLGRS